MFINGLKLIRKSQVLSKEEKRKLFTFGLLEVIINSYVNIIQLPFKLIGYILIIIQHIFELIANGLELFISVLEQLCIMLDTRLPQVNLTRGKAREKVLKEIKDNKIYKVK